MSWNKKPHLAQYQGAAWDNVVAKVPNLTAEQAMRVAFANPAITFFFVCRDAMVLSGAAAAYNPFLPGDAVFFTGRPWYGSAPQCDAYEKTPITTIYIGPTIPQQFPEIATHTLPGGTPAIDVVCIGAGNYASNAYPCLRANNNNPPTSYPFNLNVQAALDPKLKLISQLQAKGITVLLTVTNGWTEVGWSQFTNQAVAQTFVDYLKNDVVGAYGLDGIDIDDEFTKNPTPQDNSLAMVTTLMKQTMPDKLITKALFQDYSYFQANWNGHTLAGNLSYGWEMSYYGGGPNDRLAPYLQWGMGKNQLSLGFSAEPRFSGYWGDIPTTAKDTVADGYAGGMMYYYENPNKTLSPPQTDGVVLTGQMVDAMDGPGSWH